MSCECEGKEVRKEERRGRGGEGEEKEEGRRRGRMEKGWGKKRKERRGKEGMRGGRGRRRSEKPWWYLTKQKYLQTLLDALLFCSI